MGLSVKNINKWIHRSRQFYLVITCALIAAFCHYIYFETKLGRHLRQTVELSTSFYARTWQGRSPSMSPNLKIIALDDPTADLLGTADLPARELGKILSALSRRNPRAVLIPKMFTFGTTDDVLQSLSGVSKGGKTFIAVAGFMASATINSRVPLDPSRVEFDPKTYGLDKSQANKVLIGHEGFIYGPHPSYWKAFDRIGHVGLVDASQFEPFIRINDLLLPHLSLYAADRVVFANGQIKINNRAVRTHDGTLLINFLDQDQIKKKTYSIKSVLKMIDARTPLNGLDPGDVVVILPSEATGSIDYLDTPAGKMRSSSLFISQVNSMMTTGFIYSVPGVFAFLLLGSAIGLWIGSIVRSTRFVSSLAFVILSAISLGVYSFVYFNLDAPWLPFCFTMMISGLIRHSRIASKSEMRIKVLKQALHRMIADEKIDQLADHPETISFAPQEQNVSILFFDLVSFSLVAEGRNPKEMFDELKVILNLICDSVYAHDGIVDKILGDGALCLFGMSLSQVQTANHAEKAVNCGVDIQRRMLARNLSLQEGHVAFPVRVGVHTSSAFMGDLGNGEKIEFTVIGPGVNFARRLEEACEPYRIMISASTLASLSFDKSKINPYMVRRDIGIKHHDELFEAYEINAFANHGRELDEALSRHNAMLGRQRIDERFIFPEGRELRVKFPMGSALIKDFSSTGVRVAAGFYVARGFQTAMSFDCDSEDIRKSLVEHHLQQVQVVVRWGKPLADGTFALGLQYVAMQKDVRDILLDILRSYNEDVAHAKIRRAV